MGTKSQDNSEPRLGVRGPRPYYQGIQTILPCRIPLGVVLLRGLNRSMAQQLGNFFHRHAFLQQPYCESVPELVRMALGKPSGPKHCPKIMLPVSDDALFLPGAYVPKDVSRIAVQSGEDFLRQIGRNRY